MENVSKPWQIVQAKIIELAIKLIENKSDFDEKIAYLLIDISVETIMKSFLGRSSIDVEYKKFPQIVDEVNKKLADEKKAPLNKKNLMDFHNNRNTLYHQGELLMPMGGVS